ncbi:MAG: hypothetical protein EOP46_21025 [Sphingobacteriaceae bacterium]|nr:MAG: hypothetical protein EOP46_21025 [Sphingobacteriaceae bacterium]
MTPRSFWTILIKLVGVWLLFNSLSSIPQIIGLLYNSFNSFGNSSFDITFTGIIIPTFLLLLSLGVYVVVFLILIFKTDFIIGKFKLDKGFSEERLEFNISQTSVLQIAIIVIGALMLVDSLPAFFRHVYSYVISVNQRGNEWVPDNKGWLFYTLIQSIVAYLLMTNSRTIVSYINKNIKNEEN